MGNTAIKSLSTLSDDDQLYDRLQNDRGEGCDLLRDMVAKQEEIDWGAVIQEVESLHEEKSAQLKKRGRRRKGKSHPHDDHQFTVRVEKDREQGRILLRDVSSKSDGIDWPSVIDQAEFLRQHEQEHLKKRERLWRRKQLMKALERRKRYCAGSFSISAMGFEDEETNFIKRIRDCRLNASCSDTSSCSSQDEYDHTYESGYDTALVFDPTDDREEACSPSSLPPRTPVGHSEMTGFVGVEQ